MSGDLSQTKEPPILVDIVDDLIEFRDKAIAVPGFKPTLRPRDASGPILTAKVDQFVEFVDRPV